MLGYAMLTYADVCADLDEKRALQAGAGDGEERGAPRMLTYAGVCYADVCADLDEKRALHAGAGDGEERETQVTPGMLTDADGC